MKKNIILGSIALIINSSVVFSSDDTDENRMIVTANRVEQDSNEVLAVTEVISREDIERIQPESITDLLTAVAGFDIVHNGGAGQASSLFTRGTNSGQTLIVVNGVRVGSATLGSKSLSGIPVAQIERIEIVKGPRATLWGSDAIGGVIHIFTRKLDIGESSASLILGSNNYTSSSFSLGLGDDVLSNTISVSNEKSKGYDVRTTTPDLELDDDGYERTSVAIRGGYVIDAQNSLNWSMQIDEGSNEFDGFFDQTSYDNSVWNIGYVSKTNMLSTEINIGQSKDDELTFGGTVSEENGFLANTERSQINFIAHYDMSEVINIVGGLEKYRDDVSASRTMFDQEKRTTDSAFFGMILSFNKIFSELFVRHDDIEDVANSQTFNISLGYKLLDNISLSINRSEGFKVPDFNALYFPGYGNPDLKPEVSFNNELVLKTNWRNQDLILAVYKNKLGQAIVIDGVTSKNIDEAKLKGAEIVYSYNYSMLSHKLNLSYIEAKDLSDGSQLQRRAREKASYEVAFDYQSFSIFTQINYSGKRSDTLFFGGPMIELDSFTQVNVGINYQLNDSLKFNFKVNDLDNESPTTVFSYNASGRQLFFGFHYNDFN